MVRLRFSWPAVAAAPFREDFFLGAWRAGGPLQVAWSEPPESVEPAVVEGRNWWLLSNTAPLGGHSRGLVHHGLAGEGLNGEPLDGVAFRGYVLEPPLHSWSDSARLAQYWAAAPAQCPNGVFAAAMVSKSGARFELAADALGIAPLYYRRLSAGVVVFATSPRYLRCPGDGIDALAARMLMHRGGALCGDVSLVPGVRRVPPGRTMVFEAGGVEERPWFSFASLPDGGRPVTERMLGEVEEVFQAAVDRCLRLMPGAAVHLPLSSGHDSRRILAALHARRVDFLALTVRILQKDYRDLDGSIAPQMAREMGFRHLLLEYSPPPQYRIEDQAFRRLLSSEVSEHSWSAPLMRSLERQPSLVFDGLAGDVLGQAVYRNPLLYTMPEGDKPAALADLAFAPQVSRLWRERACSSLEEARAELIRHLSFLPEGRNRADLGWLMVRTRRGTGPWSQHLFPPGHLPVLPYLDHDYVRVALQCDPQDKLKEALQGRCLARFWPAWNAYAGSRRIPEDLPPQPPEKVHRLQLTRLHQMRRECRTPLLLPDLRRRLTPRFYALAVASGWSERLSLRIDWWLDPLLMIESYRYGATPCWTAEGAR